MGLRLLTSSRAEFSIWLPLLSEFFELKVDFSLLCLGKSHGDYVKKTLSANLDHLIIDEVDFDENPRTQADITKSVSRLYSQISENDLLKGGDCLMVLGDRYELLPFVTIAFMSKIPIVHFCGGDKTQGSLDDKFRDQVSLLSTLHFVTNCASGQRLRELGLPAESIFNVGHMALSNFVTGKESREDFSAHSGFDWAQLNILVTLHPDTTQGRRYNLRLANAVCEGLMEFPAERCAILFTGSNADMYASDIEEVIQTYVVKNNNFHYFRNLGYRFFNVALENFQVFVGNSSSIFYEAPVYPVACVNVGDRQRGRLANQSIVHTENSKEAIVAAVKEALGLFPASVTNPYYSATCLKDIIQILRSESVI